MSERQATTTGKAGRAAAVKGRHWTRWIWAVNGVIYALIGVLTILHFKELRWAGRSLLVYRAGGVPSPLEHTLCSRASRAIQAKEQTEDDRQALEDALAIDPNSEAAFWLGVYYQNAQDEEKALPYFLGFIQKNPTFKEAYWFASRILYENGKLDEAVKVLDDGIRFFQKAVEDQQPVLDESVGEKYNRKAVELYKSYQKSLRSLRLVRRRYASVSEE